MFNWGRLGELHFNNFLITMQFADLAKTDCYILSFFLNWDSLPKSKFCIFTGMKSKYRFIAETFLP